MTRHFRKRPVVVEAFKWYGQMMSFIGFPPDGISGDAPLQCGYCGEPKSSHGWIATAEGGHIVCPGDWIITGTRGESYPCKPDIFAEIYEEVIA